jgi:hypothetical protein
LGRCADQSGLQHGPSGWMGHDGAKPSPEPPWVAGLRCPSQSRALETCSPHTAYHMAPLPAWGRGADQSGLQHGPRGCTEHGGPKPIPEPPWLNGLRRQSTSRALFQLNSVKIAQILCARVAPRAQQTITAEFQTRPEGLHRARWTQTHPRTAVVERVKVPEHQPRVVSAESCSPPPVCHLLG